MPARRQAQPPLRSGNAWQSQVGMPAERHRHRPASCRNHARRYAELAVAGGDDDFDPVRERKRRCVDVDRRPQPRRAAPGVRPIDAPTRRAHEQPVDREAVAIHPQRKSLEINGHPRRPVAARREPVGPRRQQRQAGGGAGPQRGHPARHGEVLPAPPPQRHARHADVRQERGAELAGLQRDRGLAAEEMLAGADGHRPRLERARRTDQAVVRSRCCRRSCAASSTSLCRHSDARYTQAISPVRCTRRRSPYTNA